MEADSILSQRIKLYRKLRNMTQEELAVEIGVTTNHISSIESGRRKVSVDKLKRLCECFGVSTEDLLPAGVENHLDLRKRWIEEIDETLDTLDVSQLWLVRTMVCSLRG